MADLRPSFAGLDSIGASIRGNGIGIFEDSSAVEDLLTFESRICVKKDFSQQNTKITAAQ